MFLIVKELEGNDLQEISSRCDLEDAVTEAIIASQEEINLGSIIAVVESSSGACARLEAQRMSEANQAFLGEAVRAKLKKEISRTPRKAEAPLSTN